MRRRREEREALERLQLVESALDTQRDRTASKLGSTYSRVGFLIAADAVLLGIHPTTGVGWIAAIAQYVTILLLVMSILMAGATLVGAKVREVDPEKIRLATLDKSIAKVRGAIYRAKLDSLQVAVRHLETVEHNLRFSVVFFGVAVLVVVGQTILGSPPVYINVPTPFASVSEVTPTLGP